MNSALPQGPDDVLEKSQEFRDKDLRKIFYRLAQDERKDGNQIKAAKIILLGWNWRAYADTEIDGSLEVLDGSYSHLSDEVLTKQLEWFLGRHRDFIERAESTGLEEFDLEKFKGDIIESFEDLCKLTRIGSTAAGKVMHTLAPSTFMMWDSSIISEYHNPGHKIENSSRSDHSKGSGECYWSFLKETKHFIKENDLGVENPVLAMDQYNMAKYV